MIILSQTPARRLKDDVSTGHAMSPATIVVGKAHLRTNLSVGAAPIIVHNMAVLKKDMKMDEDLTGLFSVLCHSNQPVISSCLLKF